MNNKLVMYMPTKLFFGFNAYNIYWYPITWYFKFQKEVVDSLSKRKDLLFIYKYAAGQEWLENSVLKYIRHKGYANIFIENRPLMDFLFKVSRVILDCPTTGLYEAAAANIPVLSLYDESLNIRDSALRLFGKSVRKFSDFSEALEIINSFLDSDPLGFKVKIPISNTKTVDILSGLKNANK
jgi:hypothetical protein